MHEQAHWKPSATSLHQPCDARRQRVCPLVVNETDRLGLRRSNREAKLRFLLVVALQ
jgi:hypothetical protein